jgi:16S rRNA G966 N2-methylase RsmD
MSNKEFYRIHSQLDLPFLETPYIVIESIFNTLELKFGLKKGSNQRLIDLGSGDGRIVIYSVSNYQIKSIGVEINSSLIKEAKDKSLFLKKDKQINRKVSKNIIFKEADFFAMSLIDYDFIYIYSLPTMQKYLDHLFKTIKKGAIVVSYKFPFNGLFSYLELKFALEHKIDNQITNTFFYCKM